ncbi:glycosyltransferase [Actinacidiphila acidipaludis]|uniref:D-inositol 3-phosphate glycosyltransferase n=1 Tax=Actinacidiphila acidipaludis TaxID=2873382 RepID=A0ABS7Q713_9ACTN|nr:glycosyltransferase [Streptomyces acidipaludis]MBY8877574.1 glycosyltransferase [Streptomyces acidipaludis]
MKVLHVITGLGIGGAEQQLHLLLRHLPAECEVVTLTNPGPVADALTADGVTVTHLGMTGNRDLTVLPRLTRLIRAGHYDIVHTHLYRAGVYGRVAARLARVRTIVATEHSLGVTQIEGRPLSRATRALYRRTERMGSATIAVSETVARRLTAWGVPAGRVHLAPNGIDPAAFRFSAPARVAARSRLGIPLHAYVVGGVGRQVKGKNFESLIRAVAAVPDTHLLLAGDGPEHVMLLRLVHQLGVADRVRFAQPAEEPSSDSPTVPELLAAMDLFVSPSPEESFGVAVIEALASGLPALYVACPALEDLPPHDAPGARRIEAYNLPTAVHEERLTGPRRLPVPAAVEHYAIARTAERVMAVYEAVLAAAAEPVTDAVTGTTATAEPGAAPAAVSVPEPSAPPAAAPQQQQATAPAEK